MSNTALMYGGKSLSKNEIKAMAASDHNRLTPVLVRMHCCRFVAPAQHVETIINALEASGDFCRDVSLHTK